MTQPEHVFNKSDIIARSALGMLRSQLLLGQLFAAKSLDDWKGRRNDTITIGVPARAEAREYAFRNTVRDAIVMDELTEEQIPVTLDKMPYHATPITDEQATLDVTDFSAQISLPQVEAVARKIEGYIASALAAADLSHADIDLTSSDDPWTDFFVPLRRALNDSFVPGDSRFIIVGADVEDWLLTKDESFRRFDASGQDGLDLVHGAVIGRKANFTVVGQLNGVIPDDVAYAAHPTALYYVSGAPANPRGAVASAAVSYEGFRARQVFDYDADHLTDRSVISSIAGVVSVEDEREQEADTDGSFPLTGKNCRMVRATFDAS